MDNDLISRSALLAYVKELPTWEATDRGFFAKRYPYGFFAPDDVVKSILYAHTIDPETIRPTGHWNIRCYSTYDSWTQETDEEFYLECSECKREVWNIDQSAAMGGEYRKLVEQYPYCHCGCKMMEG